MNEAAVAAINEFERARVALVSQPDGFVKRVGIGFPLFHLVHAIPRGRRYALVVAMNTGKNDRSRREAKTVARLGIDKAIANWGGESCIQEPERKRSGDQALRIAWFRAAIASVR